MPPARLDLPLSLDPRPGLSRQVAGITWTHDRVLIAVLLACAILLTGQRTAWRLLRFVVTIAHEGGHAVTAVVMRRELAGIRLHSDSSGVTLSRGRPEGPGMVLTAMSGYPAPSLLGVGFAALIAFHQVTVMLWVIVGLLSVLLTQIRNAFGVLTVVGTGAASVAVIIWGTPRVALGFTCAFTWLLLIGGLRAVIELQRSRRRQSGGGRAAGHLNLQSDADQLARLTRLPGLLWVILFFLLSLAAVLAGAWLMLLHGVPRHGL